MASLKKRIRKPDLSKYDSTPLYLYTEKDSLNRVTVLNETAKVKIIYEKGRNILVAHNPVDLRTLQGENAVFILQLPAGSSAAGGRAGGFRERRLSKLYCFHYSQCACPKLYDVDSPEKLERF